MLLSFAFRQEREKGCEQLPDSCRKEAQTVWDNKMEFLGSSFHNEGNYYNYSSIITGVYPYSCLLLCEFPEN